jgi:hypothetical protein
MGVTPAMRYFRSAFCVEECGLVLILDHNHVIVEVEKVLRQSYQQEVLKGASNGVLKEVSKGVLKGASKEIKKGSKGGQRRFI